MDKDTEARFQRIEALMEQSAKEHTEFKATMHGYFIRVESNMLTLEENMLRLQEAVAKTTANLDRLTDLIFSQRGNGKP